MHENSQNPTAPGLDRGTDLDKGTALDLNSDVIKRVRVGGKFEVDNTQLRKFKALMNHYKLTEAQLNARIVKGYLDAMP